MDLPSYKMVNLSIVTLVYQRVFQTENDTPLELGVYFQTHVTMISTLDEKSLPSMTGCWMSPDHPRPKCVCVPAVISVWQLAKAKNPA